LALCSGLNVARAVDEPRQHFRFEEAAMGTLFVIEVYAPNALVIEPLIAEAWRKVHALDRSFSDYDPESELMRFCRKPAGTQVALSSELADIFRKSGEIYRLSGGAFDVTIGPLKRLWRQTRRDAALPSAERIAEAKALIGWEKVHLNPDDTASLEQDGMRLDLGGIAKGYAADAVLALLCQGGAPQALVAASGDIVVGDPPPGQAGWEVRAASLKDPEHGDVKLLLSHQALSTSGDTKQAALIAGTSYSHILDPATGLGLTSHRMVNVIAPRSVLADALSTALSIAGPDGVSLPPEVGFRFEEEDGTQDAGVRKVLRNWPASDN
jgi:thiamine biosynthesis lipoprotein